jgi:AcrR family transcriptional regulator
MRTPEGWLIPVPTTLAEDLAWSLVVLAGEQGLASVSFRALARHARLAPGTITNHYSSKQELFGVCTTQVGRWLTHATSDHVEDRGPLGLFPTPDDLTYLSLVSAWAQLRAYALTDASVDERASAMVPLMGATVREAFPEPGLLNLSAAWICLEGLRAELIRPSSDLTPAEALTLLEQTVTVGRRDVGS